MIDVCEAKGCHEMWTERVYRPRPPIESVRLCYRHATEALSLGAVQREPP